MSALLQADDEDDIPITEDELRRALVKESLTPLYVFLRGFLATPYLLTLCNLCSEGICVSGLDIKHDCAYTQTRHGQIATHFPYLVLQQST